MLDCDICVSSGSRQKLLFLSKTVCVLWRVLFCFLQLYLIIFQMIVLKIQTRDGHSLNFFWTKHVGDFYRLAHSTWLQADLPVVRAVCVSLCPGSGLQKNLNSFGVDFRIMPLWRHDMEVKDCSFNRSKGPP